MKSILLVLILCTAGYVVNAATTPSDVNRETLINTIAQLEALVEQLTPKIQTIETSSQAQYAASTLGTTYIRWGRTWCNGDSKLIHRGHAGGPHHAGGGAGSNFLCLHEHPEANVYFEDFASEGSFIYGLQYSMNADENYVYSMNNSNGLPATGHPVPCAACYAGNRTSTLVVPARVDCPYGWTEEYQGYIVGMETTTPTFQRQQYICLDEAPEIAEGMASQGQAAIYTVELASGTLSASPFVDGLELTCVVCTK